jgi:hypothetical protein
LTEVPATITPANWRTHPHSVWAFHNLDKLLPTRTVPCAPQVRPLERALVCLDRLSFRAGDGTAMRWPDFLDRTHTDAILVLHRGSIVFEEYRNGMAAETATCCSRSPSPSSGCSPSCSPPRARSTSLAGTRLRPELRGTMFGAAALRDLLDMRDGAPFDETYADRALPFTVTRRLIGARRRAACGGPWRAWRGGRAHRAASPTDACDGRGRLGRRQRDGSGLAELVSALLWQPIGAEADAFFVLDTGRPRDRRRRGSTPLCAMSAGLR